MATEIDALDPVPEQVTLQSGTVVVLEPLKARQFFRLLRIVTHGAMPVLSDLSLLKLDPDMDTQEFATKLLTLMALSIPDAEDETIDFVKSMCKPFGAIEGRKLNKQDAERNAELWGRLDIELDNPELDDLLTIVEAIVKREAGDIQALGKRLAAMFNLAEKTGQLTKPQPPTSATTPASSADSPAPTTFSPPSTAGPTTTSAGSASVVYGSVSPPSGNGGTTSSGGASNG